MAKANFYTAKNDVQLANDIVSESADTWVRENETPADNNGTLNTTVPAVAVLTPDTSPVWTDDELIGFLLVLGNDNDSADEFIVADNIATTLTVDLTSDVNTNDKSANFTNSGSYGFKLFGIEQFVGFTMGDDEFNDEEEKKEYKVGIPRRRIREDLVERVVTLVENIRTSGAGIFQSVHNLDNTDSNATYYVLKGSSNPGDKPEFYITLKNQSVDGKNRLLNLVWANFTPNGARIPGGGDTEYETIPVMMNANADPLRADNDGDMFSIRIEK